MLTKRTNILFDQDLWKKLTSLAKKQGTSVGELTRKAVKETYFSDTDALKKDRKEAVEGILRFREKYGKELAKGEDSVTIIRKMREDRTNHLLSLIDKSDK